MVYNIGASVTTEGIAYCKDDVMELVVIPKVVRNNPKKVEDVVISLLSIKADCRP
jgi:hypothetical protein